MKDGQVSVRNTSTYLKVNVQEVPLIQKSRTGPINQKTNIMGIILIVS